MLNAIQYHCGSGDGVVLIVSFWWWTKSSNKPATQTELWVQMMEEAVKTLGVFLTPALRLNYGR